MIEGQQDGAAHMHYAVIDITAGTVEITKGLSHALYAAEDTGSDNVIVVPYAQWLAGKGRMWRAYVGWSDYDREPKWFPEGATV